MDDEFTAAIRRAGALVRAGEPLAATRTLQRGLNRAMPGGERRSLKSVVADLTQARRMAGDRKAPVPGRAGEARRFEGANGARDYLLFLPPVPPRGLILMLHGCTQDPEDFAQGTGMNAAAGAAGLAVAYPAQGAGDNPQRCWNWFRPGDQARKGGEAALLAEMTGSLARQFGLKPGRVFAAGLSAGGAMAALLGARFPDLFDAVGVHSGLPPGTARDAVSAFAVMRGEEGQAPLPIATRLIVLHGDADRTVAPVNAQRLAMLAPAGDVPMRVVGPKAEGWRSLGRDGRPAMEHWSLPGVGHGWSGGDPGASHTVPGGPDASAMMLRFFLAAEGG